jgi:hypothetical protein
MVGWNYAEKKSGNYCIFLVANSQAINQSD